MNRSDHEAGAERRRHRLDDLLGARVTFRDGRFAGCINDVRLAGGPLRPDTSELLVEGLLVSGRHAGSLLGYDRREHQGPVLIRSIVRAIHHQAGYVAWTHVQQVDWGDRCVRLDTDVLEPLTSV
ncbi:MAG: hypothetical protein ACR2JT_04970 [Nocardioidaceae bacterium]